MISVLILDNEPAFLREAEEYLTADGPFELGTWLHRPEHPLPVPFSRYDVIVAGCEIPGILEPVTSSGISPSRGMGPAVILSLNKPVQEESRHLSPDALIFVNTGRDPASRYAELSRMIRFVAGENLRADRLAGINRLYAARDRIQKTGSDPGTSGLSDEVCRILVATGGFPLAWIGASEPDTGAIRPVALQGYDDRDFPGPFVNRMAEGAGPWRQAVQRNAACTALTAPGDPGIDPALAEMLAAQGIGSVCSIPVSKNAIPVGVLTVCSPSRTIPDESAVSLLEEIAGLVLPKSGPAEPGALSPEISPCCEKHFRKFADSLPVIVADIDREGRFLYANRTLSLLTGYSISELREDCTIYSLVAPEKHAILDQCLLDLFTGGIFDPAEFPVIRKDGTTFAVLLHTTTLCNNGPVAGVRLIAIDISKHRDVVDALTRSETMFRMLTENSGSGFFILQDEKFRYVNPYLVRATGYTLEDLDTRSVWDIVHPLDHDTIRQHREAREQDPDLEAQFEIRYVTKDGEDRFARINTTPIPFEGKPAILGTTLDVTEQRAAQEGLRQANKKLNLLGSITRHDLLNKFTALQGYLEIIQAGVIDDSVREHLSKQEQILAAIREQIHFSEDYEQIGNQKPTWHNLERVVRNVAESLPLEAQSLRVELENVEILADPLLERVFYNLMENTLRHGSDAKEIQYSAEETSEGLRIVYADDGKGVAQKDKEKIFLRGFGKNTGLGLFLIREILMITGITIRESGDPGEGARFEILVPKGYYRIPPAQE